MPSIRRVGWAVLALVAYCFVAARAEAGMITYSWSGFTEGVGSDPLGIGGDGSQHTPADGVPFALSVTVDSAATDITTGGNLGTFRPDSATLTIGGTAATVVIDGLTSISFRDDVGSNHDEISFFSGITLNGATRIWTAAVFVDVATFEMLDAGLPDVPPIFADTSSTVFSTSSSLTHVSYVPVDTPVSSGAEAAVPEPSSAALLGIGLLGLCACGWRRRCRAASAA